MQAATIIFKTDVIGQVKEFRVPSGAIVSSTSSPSGQNTAMRPPPPPPPPKHKENKPERGHHEEPSSSMPDLGESRVSGWVSTAPTWGGVTLKVHLALISLHWKTLKYS